VGPILIQFYFSLLPAERRMIVYPLAEPGGMIGIVSLSDQN